MTEESGACPGPNGFEVTRPTYCENDDGFNDDRLITAKIEVTLSASRPRVPSPVPSSRAPAGKRPRGGGGRDC